ncbi:SgcJ/EcaC family oxidoreductase [Lichenihabitans sp. Uapishka_5]|uniref:YybH family protein n=1 Tax=Lichenihabitans sp. Uapishka_5 TaxID=3037302 RepID=UPI0029E7FDAC|nr:SgcJ/EcaC family oxidoreductase [Lichenihabitans sp. Uapishka_5]MDX7953586.1 SgcJ/EcaC family oxidoreductase [Lichenihabitans sp. Uapishka_5]
MQANGTDEAAIREMLARYNVALNGGRTAEVLPLYAPDCVFMAPHAVSNVGVEAVRAAYDAVFRELAFDVAFTVVEVVQLALDWAFVRTNSAGTTRHAPTGRTTTEANQELFLLKKGDGARWRIARYSFSPTNPPGDA